MQNGNSDINSPEYLIDEEFYQRGRDRFKSYEENYISILYDGSYYRVYNKLLYSFLTSRVVEVDMVFFRNRTADADLTEAKFIDGTSYLKSYIEGYKAGEDDFDKYFPLNVFQGEQVGAFINSLHRKCFHEPNQVFKGDGWVIAAQQIPYLISHTLIKYYGFFCAKLTKYEQLVDNYSELFEALVNCESSDHGADSGPRLKILPPKNNPVIIAETVRDRLYDALKLFINKEEHPKLAALINEARPARPSITVNCQQNTLAFLFWEIREKELITGGLSVLTKWICDNFSPFKYQTVYDVLRLAKKNKPKKGSRIIIELEDL